MSAKPTDLYVGRGSTPKSEAKEMGFAAEAGATPRMLDIVRRNGDRLAFPYPYLICCQLTGNEKLELTFTEHVVTFSGRNLAPLYQSLLLQTVWRIEESGTGFDDAKQMCWIESVVIKPRAR
jgi:hypothetical protein